VVDVAWVVVVSYDYYNVITFKILKCIFLENTYQIIMPSMISPYPMVPGPAPHKKNEIN
jgi:hypothetical protein